MTSERNDDSLPTSRQNCMLKGLKVTNLNADGHYSSANSSYNQHLLPNDSLNQKTSGFLG